MDRLTVDRYQRDSDVYAGRPAGDGPQDRLRAFIGSTPAGVRLDAGCGTGRYLTELGSPAVGLDASTAMLAHAARAAPAVPLACGDLAQLPLRTGSIAGAWANKSLQHLPDVEVPHALAELHRVLAVGGRLDVQVFEGDAAGRTPPDSDLPDRLFTGFSTELLADLLEGAGFAQVEIAAGEPDRDGLYRPLTATAGRDRTLADTVGPGMRLLLCGLNPSLYAADAGVAFARPGNRFWPALRAAGLTDLDRDPNGLLRIDNIGLTDLVKRATLGADELNAAEYTHGLARVRRLCDRLRPAAVCFIGLAGWRAALDRTAVAGWQTGGLGETPVYLMPSTSGLNAHASSVQLAEHLAAAAALPG